MKQYLDLARHILQNGTIKEDRTGTGVKSVFGYQMRFNLQEGFPLVTTKKTHLKSIIGELLWFLSGSTNANELREKYGVTIWDEWADENGELSNIYSKQWVRLEHLPKVVNVPTRKVKPQPELKYPLFHIEEPILSDEPLVGQTFTHEIYGDYRVLERVGSKGNRKLFTIQFLNSGYKYNVTSRAILNKSVRDAFHFSIFGQSHFGGYSVKNEIDRILKKCWESMISRCYNLNDRLYSNYGGKGVFVCNRWKNFSNFIEDVKLIPNWHKKKDEPNVYNLDKDYFGSNCYSKETCVWLNRAENSLYRDDYFTPFKVKYKNNSKEEIWLSGKMFSEVKGLKIGKLKRLMKGIKGYKEADFEIEKLAITEGFNYRYQLPINQIENVITQLKSNPDGRRIIVSGWNVAEIEDMALPCCHCFFQFYTRELTQYQRLKIANRNFELSLEFESLDMRISEVNEWLDKNNIPTRALDCQLYQRSADVFLGVPFNIASYALLTMMMAKEVNMIPGEFIHALGDAHLYSNHIEQIKLQLDREPHPLPTMKLNPNVKSIYSYTPEDFTLENYVSHPAIKAPVAI